MEGEVGGEYLRLFGFDHIVGQLPNDFYFVSQGANEVIRVVSVLEPAGNARGGGERRAWFSCVMDLGCVK